jgi:hypothetical protein
MNSKRAVAVLITAFAIVGCHKKAATAGAEGGTADSTDAAATTATDSGATTATDDSAAGDATAASDASEGGSDQGDDGGGSTDSGPATVTATGGASYAGSYNCFGTLTLRQVGNTVSGDAVTHGGGKTVNNDVTCKIAGDRCTGFMNRFTANPGGAPKPAGKSRVTFRLVSGGLEYTEAGPGGNSGQGFCKRN